MERNIKNCNNCPQKTPGTQRRPYGTYKENYAFEPVDLHKKGPQRSFAVVHVNGQSEETPESGAEPRTPPDQFDFYGNRIGSWWPEESNGVIRLSVGQPDSPNGYKVRDDNFEEWV
jgi:hypothetical protein